MELEALAALKALEFAADLGLIFVVLEGDSEILMNALMDNSLLLASFGLLIQDIKAYAEFFRCISFSHVHKEGNIVAHNLAIMSLVFQCGWKMSHLTHLLFIG